LIRISIILACATILGTGCANVSEAGYYWGSHAQTYYAWVKAPSDETLTQHIAELEGIIEESRERDLRVPPGVHAELGFFLSKADPEADPMPHYRAEMEKYPESRVFIERLISMEDA
jgi:hypothetical protein